MKRTRVQENIDRRYLGAIRFVDSATGNTIRRSMDIQADGLRFIINPSFLHVIDSAKGLGKHYRSFAVPPDEPDLESLSCRLIISDPLQNYLPRIKRIALPRNPDPAVAHSLFKPIPVRMFSAPSGKVSPNWSIIRASVLHSEAVGGVDDMPVRGALLRIVREEDNVLLANGLTDKRGEALVIVPGIPIHSFVTAELPGGDEELDDADWLASGEVMEKETSVRLTVIVDSTLGWPVDPELLEENNTLWLCKVQDKKDNALEDDVKLKLKTGQTQTIKLFAEVPAGI